MEREGIEASMEIPIKSAAHGVLGGFAVGYTTGHEFSEDEQRVLVALADRAAVAISNAELYARAQQAASLEERQRLARELHDSVSQALYGIALGARTARELIDRDPSRATEPIDYVLSLAEAGLAEMRALIFELRPESLETEGLVAALQKQAAATRARYGIAVDEVLGDEPDAPLPVKETAYRIAQEALHNVVKHAKASRVELRLALNGNALELEVADDGIGFDPEADYAGHLGLRSMRERAARLGGELTIESPPGGGARVRARLPAGLRATHADKPA
jgi:signal transduction histidine kinase